MLINISDIPTTPGVYLFKDPQGIILYVGKAKHLRRRVSSYFRPLNKLSPKTVAMLSHADKIDTLSTNTEKEALLLEASLIKKHLPRYNIVLRDDKQYLLFYIDRTHPYPRLSIVRHRDKALDNEDIFTQWEYNKNSQTDKPNRKINAEGKKKGNYFGPFTSALSARETWRLIHRIFPLRRCSNRSFKNRVRPCLYHHLGQCLAPCTNSVSPREYAAILQRVEMFLNGRSSELVEQLKKDMLRASSELNFEQAANLRDQIKSVQETLEKQSAIMHGISNLDAIGLAELKGENESGLGLGIIFVRQGRVLGGKTFFWPGLTLIEGPEVISSFLIQFYETSSLIPGRILLPWLFPLEDKNDSAEDEVTQDGIGGMFAHKEQNLDIISDIEDNSPLVFKNDIALLEELLSDKRNAPVFISAPRGRVEKQLINMASTNAAGIINQKDLDLSVLIAQKLQLPTPARRIEVVDVSHTAGREPRIGLVVFENGKPLREEFRAYTVKDLDIAEGDDYGALAHFAKRRIESGPPWPDLLLVDGGRGQLTAVARGMAEAGGSNFFALAGIAKAHTEGGRADRRAGNISDRIFILGRSNPLNLKPGSPELLFLQMIRNTAHDHAIGKHRNARDKAALSGELIRLPGVGPKTAKVLWDRFDSLYAMAAASQEELAKLPNIGKIKAAQLWQELRRFA